jgi:hypothetical protein
MTLYYVKQDNMSWCCEDDSGPYYEDHEESFVNCECVLPDGKMTADHLHSCNGGGPVLQWREATEKELIAWVAGTQDGYGDGFEEGAKRERERIIELLSDDAEIWHSENLQKDLIALIKGKNK